VYPLLESRCFECHSGSAVSESRPSEKAPSANAESAADSALDRKKGGLVLSRRSAILKGGDSGPALVPGKPEESLIISAVSYESFEMPPRSRLPVEEVQILERWIADGAFWPDSVAETPADPETAPTAFPLEERRRSHWAWQPIRKPAIPLVKNRNWANTDVDRFVQAKLEDAGLEPAPDADRRTILRRLYFDLIGLPPTPADVDAFLNDAGTTESAMETVVTRLLESPKFGERWARHWLDLVRYAETLGHEFDYPLPHAWQYRDYVIRAFNDDVPYDQFVREHIAGDLLPDPRKNRERGFNESEIATGFWYLGEDKHAPVDVRGEEAARIDNQIDVFSRTFLGLTVACARCHDHKFDAVTTADYYALSGFLQSSRRRTAWRDLDGRTSEWQSQLIQARKGLTDHLFPELQRLTSNELLKDLTKFAMSEPQATASNDPNSGQASVSFAGVSGSDVGHPLSLAVRISQLPGTAKTDAAQIKQVAIDWCREVQAAEQSVPAEQNLAQFDNGLPEGWKVYGEAFPSDLTDGLISGSKTPQEQSAEALRRDVMSAASWTDAGPQLKRQQGVSSRVLAPGLRGVLQSPTFELKHPEILVLAAGRSSRMRLVIDGYVMNEFSGLLFDGTRQSIDSGDEFRWIRISGDTHRYQGHRCHLEFLDENDGWFAIREIRFAGSPGEAPPKDPLPGAASIALATSLTEWLQQQKPGDVRADLILRKISEVTFSDRHWPAIASSAGLLSESHGRPEFLQLTDRWKQLAGQTPESDPVLVMCDGTGEDEHIMIRGSHRNPGPVVPRRFLEALSGRNSIHTLTSFRPPVHSESGRLELAEQLVSDSNPLTARVMVNRIWQHLLGRGIVATPDNFGANGELPSNPELLDYLASEFRTQGWSVHQMIRTITLSRVYRMSSARNPEAEQKDPRNLLHHRAMIKRLEGEAIRDAILAVSGRLDSTMSGPSVPVYLTPYMQGRGRPKDSGPLDGAGRRSIYQAVNRNFLSPFMLAFDTPAPATSVGRRNVSNVPDQALILLNSEFISQQAALWAAGLIEGKHATAADLIQTAYRQALARNAEPQELKTMEEFLVATAAEQGIPATSATTSLPAVTDLCHVILNQKEFLFLD
ncbi:MAG: PSD1 and planctomycete cytochrome C domain-containing protein, partial [Planctomyces sp.]